MPEINNDMVRILRINAHLTQKELAARSGLSVFTIRRAETLSRSDTFTHRTFRALAEALSTEELKVVPEDLLYSDEWD